MSNRRSNQFTLSPHNKATILDCSFTVAAADTAGFGVTALKKSGRISSVFMNTSQTPGTAANGLTNPNPEAGVILVTLQDNYSVFLNTYPSFQAPGNGTSTATLTTGHPYVITVLGSSTLAQWIAAGLPTYITPAIGVSFTAKANIAGGGMCQPNATTGSNIDHIELFGGPNVMNSNGANIGGQGVGMSVNFLTFKGAALTAPTDGTIINLNFYMNDSAFGV